MRETANQLGFLRWKSFDCDKAMTSGRGELVGSSPRNPSRTGKFARHRLRFCPLATPEKIMTDRANAGRSMDSESDSSVPD